MIENNAVKVNLEKGAVETGKGIGKLADAFFKYLGLRDEKKQDRKMIEMLNSGKFENPNYLVTYNSTNLSLTPQSSIEERAQVREEAQSIRKQNNLETVVLNASNELNDDSEVSDEPLDDYWVTRFFDMASDISVEELQILWGKILAGEIQHPETFSLRALETLRNITSKEAEIFKRLSRYILSWGEYTFLLADDELLDKYGVNYHDLMTLEECGLLNTTILDIEPEFSGGNVDYINCGHYKIIMKWNGDGDVCCAVALPVYRITQVGVQIYNLFLKQPNKRYLLDVIDEIKQNSYGDSQGISLIIVENSGDVSI